MGSQGTATVRLFAALRDAAGPGEVTVAAPAPLDRILADLCDRFGQRFAARLELAAVMVDGVAHRPRAGTSRWRPGPRWRCCRRSPAELTRARGIDLVIVLGLAGLATRRWPWSRCSAGGLRPRCSRCCAEVVGVPEGAAWRSRPAGWRPAAARPPGCGDGDRPAMVVGDLEVHDVEVRLADVVLDSSAAGRAGPRVSSTAPSRATRCGGAPAHPTGSGWRTTGPPSRCPACRSACARWSTATGSGSPHPVQHRRATAARRGHALVGSARPTIGCWSGPTSSCHGCSPHGVGKHRIHWHGCRCWVQQCPCPPRSASRARSARRPVRGSTTTCARSTGP
jgi:molybdopterin converting factor small subunit